MESPILVNKTYIVEVARYDGKSVWELSIFPQYGANRKVLFTSASRDNAIRRGNVVMNALLHAGVKAQKTWKGEEDE